MDEFIVNDIVLASEPLNGSIDTDFEYTQRFIKKVKGVFYCEMDDGGKELIPWGKCRKDDINDYYYKGKKAQ